MKRVVTAVCLLVALGCSSEKGSERDAFILPVPPSNLPSPAPEAEPTPVEHPDPPASAFDEDFTLAWADAEDVQVAAGSSAFLVVWVERAGAIRGRFVSASEHSPLGPSFDISDGAVTSFADVAVSPGGEFVVVWGSANSIRAAKVAPETGASPSTEIGVGSASGRPHVGWTGSGWLVTWRSSGVMGDWLFRIVRGMRLNADLEALDSEPPRLCHQENAEEAFVVGAEDGVAVLVCSGWDQYRTWTTRLDEAGNESADALVRGGLPESAASNGREVLVTFGLEGPTESVAVDALTQVAGERTVLAPELRNSPRRQHSASAWSGSRWLVVKEMPGLVEPDVLLDDTRVFTSAWSPRIAAAGGVAIAVAIRAGDVVARVFESGGAIADDPHPPVELSPVRVTTSSMPELGPEQRAGYGPGFKLQGTAIAVAAGRTLVSWSIANGPGEVRFRIEGAAGATPDVLLDQRDDTHSILGPPVAGSNGSEFLVGWFSGEGYKRVFKVARVALDGTVRDPGGIRLGDNVDFASGSLVWHRDHWIAVWRGDWSTWMRRLHADGSFIDSSPVYLGEGWRPSSVLATSNGETALVVWSDIFNLRGVLFDEGLEYRDVPGIASAAGAIRPHSVGTDGDRYLVAYDCDWECDSGAPPSGMVQPRIWSIEVDGRSGIPLETRPQPLSRLLYKQYGGIYGDAAIAHGSDWLTLLTETSDPLAYPAEGRLFIGEQEIFPDADLPSIVRDGSMVVVAARRDGDVVYRIGLLPE